MNVRITKARLAMAGLFVLAGVGLGSLLNPLVGDALATVGQVVNISDHSATANFAKVDAGGKLAVGDGGGSLTVDGTVSAKQSGTWSVAVDGNSAVKSADTTTLAGSFVGSPAGGGAFTAAVSADVTHDRTVRVLTNCFSGSACGNITVNVYSIVGSRSYLVDQFVMTTFISRTRTYDVVGEALDVQLQNNNSTATPNIGVAVYGRAN